MAFIKNGFLPKNENLLKTNPVNFDYNEHHWTLKKCPLLQELVVKVYIIHVYTEKDRNFKNVHYNRYFVITMKCLKQRRLVNLL